MTEKLVNSNYLPEDKKPAFSARRSERKVELLLFFLLFFSFAYFYQGGGANQNARLNQIRSIVELRQLNLGPFAGSHDIVQVGRKTYPNKAPGTSLVGVIPYFLVSRLKPVLVAAFSESFYRLFSCYLVTVLVVSLTCALGSVVFFRLLGLFSPRIGPRLLCTIALFLGTPVFAYSTMLYGHMVGSMLTLFSFYLLYKYTCLQPDAPHAFFMVFLAGLSGGWAVVTEYPTIVIVFFLSLFCMIYSFARSKYKIWVGLLLLLSLLLLGVTFWVLLKFGFLEPPFDFLKSLVVPIPFGEGLSALGAAAGAFSLLLSLGSFFLAFYLAGGRLSRFLLFFLGLLAPAGILLLYNYLVFGHPFFVAYLDKRAAAHAAYRQGPILGFGLRVGKTVKALYQTSFGPFRGFFHLSPLLILIFPGTYYFLKGRERRGLGLTLWLMFAVYFFINILYPYWYGGKALGPRHAMEMLPYMCLLGLFFIIRFPRFSSLLIFLSVFFMLTATAVRPEEYVAHPFRDLYFDSFFQGAISIRGESTFVNAGAFNSFNLGEVAGLKGQLSLLPLYLFWLTGGLLMFKFAKKASPAPGGKVYPGSAPGGKLIVGLLVLILIAQVINLIYQLQLQTTLADLSDSGAFSVPAAQAPASRVHVKASPGHHLQVWEVKKPFSPGDTIKVKIQHAAAGKEGGIFIVAFGDRNRDGKPDIELGRSPLLKARHTGDWSYWTFPAPEGKIFVGDTWPEGSRVFFERTGWKTRDISPVMFYSAGALPVSSTSPRSTNMAVEVIKKKP